MRMPSALRCPIESGDLGTSLHLILTALRNFLCALIAGACVGVPALAEPRWIAIAQDGTQVAALEPAAALPVATVSPALSVAVRNRIDGSTRYRVTLCAGCAVTGLLFTPDGRALVLLQQDTRSRTTQLLWSDGASSRVLTTIAGFAAHPRWSPDGTQLSLLATISPRKEAGAIQAGEAMTGEIGARVDTQRIAVVAADGGLARLVSRAGDYVYDHDWLPGGNGFVAVSAPGNGDNNWWIARLVTVALADGALREVFDPRGMQIARPVVQADGRSVAFIGGLMSDLATANGEVWTVPLDGGRAVNLTPGFAGSFTALSRRGAGWVGVAQMDGDVALVPIEPVAPASAGGLAAPLWRQPVQVGPVAFDAQGQTVAMGVQAFDRAPELQMGPLTAPARLPADAAPSTPRASASAQAERVTWRNDGRELQGWLLLPPAGKAVRGLVTDVHGGPAAAWQPEYVDAQDPRGQLLNRGVAIFLPNPRGSSGRGEAFKRLVVRDVGQGDFSDVMSGIDAVLTRLPPEAARHLGLMGASYGGYLAMWANTRTERFSAIVAGSGIANWVSYAGQNGINEWLRPYFGTTVYEDAAPYRAASPIEAMRRAKSPTLLYVGERDIETPAAQSLEYWRALRALGVASTLMVYAGEGHAIQSPQNVADLNRRIVGWFDRYLPGPP